MKNITPLLDQIFMPYKALLFYSSQAEGSHYVESYDMDSLGRPINAHPLSIKESRQLSESLKKSDKEKHTAFLQPEGLIPQNILYFSSAGDGCAVWFTPRCSQHLLFKKELGIGDGEAMLPPLLWRATKNHLWVWALGKENRPDLSAPLYFAPFFNCYIDGRVCMGNVDINVPKDCRLERFMAEWEKYFFGSAFSHLLEQVSPVKGNIVQLWKRQVGKVTDFPVSILKKNGRKLKDILS
ncbi:PRTRC system protein B [Pedobacter sp. KLB.chiD]|uniref:PRTRC system protein B n=1 Tax=Pedobacter sp. KLB.chiD TaxID=3387402 RepID=UPI00399B4821